MKDTINLSYIITTYNKLPYLKQVVTNLINNITSDEEIIVTDGGSTDGTVQYLKELFNQNKIHKFVSESDLGQSHGLNKAIFMANGELIKLINDDDAFYIPAIRKCKEIMLQHTEVEILCGQMGGLYTNKSEINIEYYETIVRKIKNHLTNRYDNMITCDLPVLMRRSAMPKLGLFNTTCKLADNEFFHRVSGIAKIGTISLPVAVRISNPQSVLVTLPYEKYISEVKRVNIMYGAEKLMGLTDYSIRDVLKSKVDRILNKLKITSRLKRIIGIKSAASAGDNSYQELSEEKIISIFRICDKWLEEKNRTASSTFSLF